MAVKLTDHLIPPKSDVASLLRSPIILLVLLAAAILYASSHTKTQARNLPPGPRSLPIIGNLHQINLRAYWLTFSEWKKEYGPIVYASFAGMHCIILGDLKTANDLLDRRSSIYSSRPRNIVAGELLTGKMAFSMVPMGEYWRKARRASHEALNNTVVHKYWPIQEFESLVLVDQLLKDPKNWHKHVCRVSSSTLSSLLYGLPPIIDNSNPDIMRVQNFTTRSLRASAPGAYFVEYFTWMEYLPRWMCAWRRYAEDWFAKDSVLFESLFNGVHHRMTEGIQKTSVVSTIIEKQDKLQTTPKESAWIAATLYAAGTDTSSGVMEWLVLTLMANPGVQKRAQEELDQVVGRDRLPTFKDLDALPYIHAIYTEIMRWRPLGTVNVPHLAEEDDWYEGYFIPKGSIIIPNLWTIHNDEALYGPDTHTFNPSRFIDAEGKLKPAIPESKDENHFTFGFGRRLCPGRHLADNTLFINIARLLWACTLTPPKDGEGQDIIPSLDFQDHVVDGLVTRTLPFDCDFRPRFPDVPDIISHEMREQEY